MPGVGVFPRRLTSQRLQLGKQRLRAYSPAMPGATVSADYAPNCGAKATLCAGSFYEAGSLAVAYALFAPVLALAPAHYPS